MGERIELGTLILNAGTEDALWTLEHRDGATRVSIGLPRFEVAGQERASWEYVGQGEGRELSRGGRQTTLDFRSTAEPTLHLEVIVRSYPQSPLLRFRFRLTAATPTTFTKTSGYSSIRYVQLRSDLTEAQLTEIQLSHFDHVAHSYMPYQHTSPADDWLEDRALVGPIAILHTANAALLLAYEHGADHPDSFFEFQTTGDRTTQGLDLVARKGNVYHGQPLGPDTAWESVWFELGLAPVACAEMLKVYRTFFLQEICENVESRQPYLYYNTWNYQERNRYFRNQPYLTSMHYDRIDTEIDIAHRLGIEVFVIDTGWYSKTGDWEVNTERFPDSLRSIKSKLDSYGMQLGLWFNPTVAALTSEVHQAHPEWTMTRNGKSWQRPIWETEDSTSMCLASPYADYFIEKMVRLHDELGVSYFKWDAIQQYECDSPLHDHGTADNPSEERADCYAYSMGRQMIHIVEEVTRRCPQVIVDFDITEGRRFVGLGFLSVGKYFLINNGPYFHDFDIPSTTMIDPNTINVFFYPGAARPRICRQGIKYDSVIPSILFLTHYLPDPPLLSQHNSLASLMLGGNGIWGDLLSLGEGDLELLSEYLSDYKRIGAALTRAYPRVHGFIGSSPEIYEKLDPESASGAVIFFTVTPGSITHVTQPLICDQAPLVKGADSWECLPDGRLKIRVDLAQDDARVVYVFGGGL